MTKDEALKLALEALDLLAKYENPSTKIQVRKPRDGGPIVTMYPHKVATDAAALLRERLAQPEQEPVAWLIWLHGPAGHFDHKQFAEMEFERRNKEYPDPDRKLLPLYTTPPASKPWVGLTSEDIEKLAEQVGMLIDKYGLAVDAQNGLEDGVDAFGFARAIEAKLKEKNT